MTKLQVNYNSLSNNILPHMESALDYLRKSLYNIDTLNIPIDYEYASYLKNIFNDNLSSYNKLLNKKNKIELVNKTFKQIEQENSLRVKLIKNVNLEVRKKSIY